MVWRFGRMPDVLLIEESSGTRIMGRREYSEYQGHVLPNSPLDIEGSLILFDRSFSAWSSDARNEQQTQSSSINGISGNGKCGWWAVLSNNVPVQDLRPFVILFTLNCNPQGGRRLRISARAASYRAEIQKVTVHWKLANFGNDCARRA